MARIAFPYLASFRIRNTNRPPFVEPSNESRAYKRVGNQFEPVGWWVRWSDGKEQVILDTDLQS